MPNPVVTEHNCNIAWRLLVMPTIQAAAEESVFNKFAGCVVVLNPATPYEPKYNHALNGQDDSLFNGLVLWQYRFGDEGVYDIDRYVALARSKAFISYKTGLPSHQVQQVSPFLYQPGMTKWGGSAVAGDGPMKLIVGFSGVQWYFDQMISEMMISAITALCHEQVEELMASDEIFVQDPEA